MTNSVEDYEYDEEKFEDADADWWEGLAIQSLSVHGSGTKRTWRELQIPQGKTKYCNWSAFFKILDESGKEVKCDWIEVTDCNFKIKQGPIWKETSRISFTTKKRKGWKSLKTVISLKVNGSIHKVTMKM